MTAQPSLFGDDYAAALAAIKASKVPGPIVLQHLKYGIRADHTCGECGSWLELWVHGVHRYCSRAFSSADVAATTPACGKWRAKG